MQGRVRECECDINTTTSTAMEDEELVGGELVCNDWHLHGGEGYEGSRKNVTEPPENVDPATTAFATPASDPPLPPRPFPDEVLEHVLAFITSHKDRNAVSLVCKSWLKADRWSRRSVFIGNCYSCSPEILTRRFPRTKSLTLKGRPRFSDFNLVPPNWGANVLPWLQELAAKTHALEELRLKRMTITDEGLSLIAHSFPNFRALILIFCDGFSTDGLANIAKNCRNLRELDLQECVFDDRGSEWLSAFPETFTSLTSLNLTSLTSDVNFTDLERLVCRCSQLEKLKLNRSTTLDQVQSLLLSRGSTLKELGIGSFIQDVTGAGMDQLENMFNICRSMSALSGFWEVIPVYLPLLYPICHQLRELNLSESPISSSEFTKLISQCPLLQCLLVQDLVEDRGLEAVAATCQDLRQLRVIPWDITHGDRSLVTEKGMVAISRGCRELRYILYFCNQMTNAALEEFASNCPKMTHFRLCIMTPLAPDYTTKEPMDEGFGAVVRICKGLKRLSVSGWLTDRAFELIGKYAKEMRSLSLAFVGESGCAMEYLMQGCESLKKLEIRDCPFGDAGLLSGIQRYYQMRGLWMSLCDLSLRACRALAKQMPLLNVEMIVEDDRVFPSRLQRPSCEGNDDDEDRLIRVDKLYFYRTLVGPRTDTPPFVYTL
ncbi:hypothetical protein KP509_02G101000 [Ceratopteris richardii]|uniref:F-box domain-containing protein n=1 Tax=Ceratopteris richardii TaxID=49495 RepID=A0A8T2VGJ3_CERRI|nr:hypothetical protein KP509_02G101000 [Ceratopteris richardii]